MKAIPSLSSGTITEAVRQHIPSGPFSLSTGVPALSAAPSRFSHGSKSSPYLSLLLTPPTLVLWSSIFMHPMQEGKNLPLLADKLTPQPHHLLLHCVDLACFYPRTQSIKEPSIGLIDIVIFPPWITCCLYLKACVSLPHKRTWFAGSFVPVLVQTVRSPSLQGDTKWYQKVCLCTEENWLCVGEIINIMATIITSIYCVFTLYQHCIECSLCIASFCPHNIPFR